MAIISNRTGSSSHEIHVTFNPCTPVLQSISIIKACHFQGTAYLAYHFLTVFLKGLKEFTGVNAYNYTTEYKFVFSCDKQSKKTNRGTQKL